MCVCVCVCGGSVDLFYGGINFTLVKVDGKKNGVNFDFPSSLYM